MRVMVVLHHPEVVAELEQRLGILLGEREGLELELVFVSLAEEQAPGEAERLWREEIAPEIEARLARLGRPARLVHAPRARLLDLLFEEGPPALVVLAYQHWSETMADLAGMLAVRRLPTLLMGQV